MTHDCLTTRQVKKAQVDVFRAACNPRTHGMTLVSISNLSGIPISTVRSWAGGKGEVQIMSLAAVHMLSGVLPDELLTCLVPQPSEESLINAEIEFGIARQRAKRLRRKSA